MNSKLKYLVITVLFAGIFVSIDQGNAVENVAGIEKENGNGGRQDGRVAGKQTDT